jgi:hypothetical protein
MVYTEINNCPVLDGNHPTEEKMQPSQLTKRFTTFPKIWKFNIALLIMVMLAGTFAVSYAGDTNKLAYGKCGARITLVLDRSSSIGVSQFKGSQANVDKIKSASQDLFNAVKGPDSYTDVITFASVAERSNTGGWFHVKDQAAANWQSMVTHGIPFKVGATNESSGNRYWDGLPASNEGLTNWEGALNLAISSQQQPFP